MVDSQFKGPEKSLFGKRSPPHYEKQEVASAESTVSVLGDFRRGKDHSQRRLTGATQRAVG